MTRDQFLNVLAFLILMADERATAFIADKSPAYIVEKWERYLGDPPGDGPSWKWGLHPKLQAATLDPYVEAWAEQMDDLFGPLEPDGDTS